MDPVRTRTKNTLVFFVSDNGPWLEDFVLQNSGESTAHPFKGGKGQAWDGGYRVPAIVWWPGRVRGNSLYNELVTTMDIFPTVMHLAGITPGPHHLDGKDITNVLLDRYGGARQNPWHDAVFPIYCNTRLFAARWKQFKMHYISQLFKTNLGDPTPTADCGGECCPFLEPGAIAFCACQDLYAGLDNTGTFRAIPMILTETWTNPIIFDLDKDPHEDFPLTPDNFKDYWKVHNTINNKIAAFEATLVDDVYPPQINFPFNASQFQPPCPGSTPTHIITECNTDPSYP